MLWISYVVLEAKIRVEIEELPTMEAEKAKIGEAIDLIALKVKPLETLPESDEEEDDGEWIAPVMNSFFDTFKYEAEKDTADTTLAPKDSTLLAEEKSSPISP